MIRQDEARWRSRAAVVLDVPPGAHDAASFEVAVEAAASVTARLCACGDGSSSSRPRVSSSAPAATPATTYRRARHRRPRRPRPSRRRVREPARPPARRPRRRGLGRVDPRHAHAPSARSAASAWSSSSPNPRWSRRTLSVVVVDASSTPFATAWNETLTRIRSRRPDATDGRRAARSAAHARRAQRGGRACRSDGSSTRAGSCCRSIGAALLPSCSARSVRWRGGRCGSAGRGRRRARRLRRLHARAVDHGSGFPARHVAHARPSARRRLAPAAHRAGARPHHRRRHPARGARGVGMAASPTGSRSAARPRSARSRPRWCSSCGLDARHRRRAAPAHRRLLRRAGAFLLAQNLAVLDRRRSWLVSQHGAHPRWFAPAALLGGAVVVVRARRRAAPSGLGDRPAARRRRHRRDGSGGQQLPADARSRSSTSARSSTTSTTSSSSRCGPTARLLAHRRARPVLGRRGRSVDAQRRGRRQRAASGSRPTAARRHAAPALPHRSARRTLAACRVPPRADQPADTLVVKSSARSSPTRRDVARPRLHRGVDAARRWRARSSPRHRRRPTAAPPPPDLAQYIALPDTDDITDRAARGRSSSRPARPLRTTGPRSATTSAAPRSCTTPTSTHDAAHGTLAFLDTKRGFCVQFASTYALMARSLGIPARVAVGYTPGELDPTGRYSVTNYEAHAWPEIWLAGVGWTNQFDPTPPSTQPGGSDLPNDTAGAPSPRRRRRRRPSPRRRRRRRAPTAVPGSTPASAPPTEAVARGRDVGSGRRRGPPWLLVSWRWCW